MSAPPDPSEDSRAILDPTHLAEHVTLERFPAADTLEGLVDGYWSVHWDLPPGAAHSSQVLSVPAVHVSVGVAPPPGPNPPPGPYAASPRVVGVTTRRVERVLTGRGWNVAAKMTTGGFGALIPGSVSALTDRELPMATILPVDAARLGSQVAGATSAQARADRLAELLDTLVARADPGRVRTAREVAALSDAAARKPELTRVGDLAAYAGMSVRTVQRLFAEYAGISPAWMLRRLRLIEAAERVARGEDVRWAQVAAELGYADQAHLTRDFTAAVGRTPSAYAAAQRRRSE